MIRLNKPISATQAEHFSKITTHAERYHAVKSGFFDLRWSDPYFIEYGKLRPVRTMETQYDCKAIIYEFGSEYREMKDSFCLFLEMMEIPFIKLFHKTEEQMGDRKFRIKVVPTTYEEAKCVAQWIQFHAIIAAMK